MDIGQYIGKPIISWLWYNPNYEERFGSTNIVCYIYPRILVSTSLEAINAEEDFPENGRIEVFIQGGQSAREVFEQFGPLVSVRLNKEIPPNHKGYNRYRVNYQPQTSGYGYASDITIEQLSSRKFYQVLDSESGFDVLQNSRLLEGVQQPFLDSVLVKTGDFLYGPFEYSCSENQLLLKSAKSFQYQVGEYLWSDYILKTLLIAEQDKNPALKILPANMLVAPQKSYDWISDEQLMFEVFNTLKSSNQYTRSQLRKIGDTSRSLIECVADEPLTDERKQRIQTLAQNLAAWSELADSVVKTALEDDSTCEVLADIAVNAHFEEIKDKLLRHEGIHERMLELRQEERELEQKIENLQQSEADLQNRVSSMRDTWENDPVILERKIALEEYTQKIQEARIQYDYERVQKEKLDKSLRLLLQQYQDEAGQISRLFDQKIISRLLDGIGSDSSNEICVSMTEPPQFNPALLHAPMSREDIVERVSSYFRDAGRKVSRNDVINYLICMSQGFITTFAGKPGTGKTTLCNLLAKSLGLVTGDTQNRFIEIPVEHGWSSQRDFIGRYNSITKTMESGNPEVLDALKKLDHECGMSNQVAPFVMLLDEANLSPIEHYWSAFLRNCDLESHKIALLMLDNGRTCKIPTHLRFLATVNFDHTTEKLSQRFLDRSWMITLDYAEISEGLKDGIKNCADMVPFSSLQKAFCLPDGASLEIDETILKKWNIIRAIFQSQHYPIMQRSLRMVHDYCVIACTCMEHDSAETQFAPLDYAFSQKVLPALNINGDLYRNLIYDLRRECAENAMPLSARHLERMQRFADTRQTGY